MTFIGITGHQNIPDVMHSYIRANIKRIIFQHSSDLTGVSSIATGADQIFAEIILQISGKLYVVIPCQEYESSFKDKSSLLRYRYLLGEAKDVEVLSYTSPSEEAFLAAGKRIVDLSQILVAIWDGKPARGKGGTADIVQYANELHVETVIIWPTDFSR